MANETLGSRKDTRARVYFDAIDKAHELLENDKDLAGAIPSCVVVGMQSVGKSAVLSRLSGIPFPQDSEVCTRVAMELRLRRVIGNGNGNATKCSMAIKAGYTKVPVDPTSDASIEAALKKAQADVLNGREFEDKISVKIDKHGPDLPEVTLVDLPGVFFAKTKDSDELEEKVKAMIAERVNNEMALICHVVLLNQDTDTISTWRTVQDADKDRSRTITILTKADLALKDGKETMKSRLKKIVEGSESSEYFMVHGASKDRLHEDDQLATVRDYVIELRMEDRVLIGIDHLIDHIEDRMLSHINEKIPEMKRLLEIELQSCKDELGKIGREAVSPLAIALRDIESIIGKYDEACKKHLPVLRKMTEEMNNKIFNIDMKPFGLVDFEESKKILIKNSDSDNNYNDHFYRLHALAMEVKYLEEDTRDHINVPFVGKEEELRKWILQFSEPCNKIIKAYIEDAFEMFSREIILPSLDSGCSDSIKLVRRKLEASVLKVVADHRDTAQERAMEVYESMKTSAFTTNSHYLTETADATRNNTAQHVQDMQPHYSAEMKPYFDTVYNILGFLKTRKKFMPEAVQLNTMRILVGATEGKSVLVDTKAAIKNGMVEESSLDLIKEPVSVVRKRKLNLEREEQIEKVFNEIRTL